MHSSHLTNKCKISKGKDQLVFQPSKCSQVLVLVSGSVTGCTCEILGRGFEKSAKIWSDFFGGAFFGKTVLFLFVKCRHKNFTHKCVDMRGRQNSICGRRSVGHRYRFFVVCYIALQCLGHVRYV